MANRRGMQCINGEVRKRWVKAMGSSSFRPRYQGSIMNAGDTRAKERKRRCYLSHRRRGLLSTKTDLAAVGRVLGLQIRTGRTITTLRAGARTSGQTSMFWGALGGNLVVAHPIMLLNLLRSYRVAMPRRVLGNRCSHDGRRGITAVGMTRRAEVLRVLSRHRSAHPWPGPGGTTIGRGGGVAVAATRGIGMRREIAQSTGCHRIGARIRLHLIPVDGTIPVGRVAHHGVIEKGVMQAWNFLHDAFARALPTTAKVAAKRRGRSAVTAAVVKTHFRILAELARRGTFAVLS